MWTIVNSVFWTGLGVVLFRFRLVPVNLPRLLGRSLYWIGVPLQILVLARRSDFSEAIWVPPLATIIILLLGLVLALAILQQWRKLKYLYLHRAKQSRWLNELIYIGSSLPWTIELLHKGTPKNLGERGSFVLASMLGNTGFIGLAIAPSLVNQHYWSWIVLYGVTHNLLGSYGLGVIVANYFSRSQSTNKSPIQIRDLLKVPSLWAFALGYTTRNLSFPDSFQLATQYGVLVVVPVAFLLIGMQLGKLEGIKSLKMAIVPSALKILVLPGLVGLSLSLLGVEGDGRLALVLMSGMPTAFANVILAEEYNLNRQIAAGTILLSTVTLPLVLPLWLTLLR